MKKKVFGRKLSRERDTRRALFRSLTSALVFHGSIRTTKAKAKATQSFVERLVSLAKTSSVSQKRSVLAYLGNDRKTADLLFTKIAPNLMRTSGFTKIIPLPSRGGDKAEMVRLEWSDKIATKVEDKARQKDRNRKNDREGKKQGILKKLSLKKKPSKGQKPETKV